jgi:hypothetical protein
MNGTTDWFVAKYDNSGNHILSFTVGGTGQDQAHRITTDNQQNIYVTGWFRTSANFNPNGASITLTGNCTGGGHDGYIAKYNSSGICQWAKQFGGVVNGTDQLTLGTSVKLLNQQQVVFSGRFHGNNAFSSISISPTTNSNGASDMFICLLDSAGNFQGLTTGINDQFQSNLLVFPNPTQDWVYFTEKYATYTKEIYDFTGKLIYKTNEDKVDLSSCLRGIYVIKMLDKNNTIVNCKIIKL